MWGTPSRAWTLTADTRDVRRGGFLDREFSDDADAGFSLIEQMIAMVVIVIVLLGLLGTLGAAAKGVVNGRQRTIAVSLGKQAIEILQGAKYTDVASGTDVLTDTMVVAGKFESEPLVPVNPGAGSYRTYPVAAGTTFSLRTFVTSVAAGYRRVTVIIDWPSVLPKHTLRFSSLVFPVVNTSYPASDGLAEAMGGLVTLSGCLGTDVFDDVSAALPGARADTTASTLRSAIGGAGGSNGHVEIEARADESICTPDVGTTVQDCPRTSVDAIADNDSISTIGNLTAPSAKTFAACTVATSGGVTMVSAAGMGAAALSAHAKTDSCTPCAFANPNDAVPWADASTITTTGSSATFLSPGLAGKLWTFGSVWSAAASIDHDATGGGIVKATASLSAPALSVFQVPSGAPASFDGAVKVGAFTAGASAASGYTTVAPTTPGATAAVQLWNGTGYTTVNWVPGTAVDQTVTAGFVVGGRQVTFTAGVKAQVATLSTVATGPRTDALAQHPSVLVVTVAVTITPTVPVAPVPTDAFTITVDYGRVIAHGTFLAQAA